MLARAQVQTAAMASRINTALAPMIGKMKMLGMLGGGAAVAGVGFGVKLAADAEQAKMAFEVMLHSASKAETMMRDLRKFAAATPFELPGITEAARALLAFSIPAEDVMGVLQPRRGCRLRSPDSS